MSKKVFNVFSILCFALVLCFMGCTELINPKTETDINLKIDLSKIIKSTRNTEETQSSVSIGENPTIKVAIYDAKKYNATTNSTDNLDLITEAQAKIVNNEAKVKLNNIPVGIDAIVFAELSFSNGNSTEVMYAGNSGVFKVKASDNKISLVLMKVEVDIEVKPDDSKPEEIINAKEPEIIIQPISCVKTTTESTTGGTAKTYLTCTAKSIDGGNLSFKWWYKSEDSTNFEEFNSILEPSLNDDGSVTSSTMQIEANKNDSFYFYCEVTNTNENATRNKVASVRSNTVQVACIEETGNQFTLFQKNSDGKEVTNVTGASISSLSEGITKVTVTNPDNSDSVWTYFVKPENKSKFIENANYKVSVELKTKSDATTVVGIAAARADYFFTVNSDWTTCEFETGYVKGSTDHDFTIGLGLSSEIEIRNLKIEKLETTDTIEPSLVFDISKDAINSYLENNNNRPGKIIEVSKETKFENNLGYTITINAPLSYKEATGATVQDVKLHLRSYGKETGANRVSFRVDNLGDNTFYTSVMADTANEKSTAWNNGTNPIDPGKFGSYEIDFPNYVANDELIVDVITSSNEAIAGPIQLHISAFAVTKDFSYDDPPFANKFFAIQIDETWEKIENGAPFPKEVTIKATDCINFDVGLFNGFSDEQGTPSDFVDVTRFLYTGNTNITDKITYEEEYDDSGNPKFKITNNSGSDKIVKISLNEKYEVVIEEVTGATITSWTDLSNQIAAINDAPPTTTEFVIADNLEATSTITVRNPVKIISDKEVTITRGSGFLGVFFAIDTGSLELGSEENKIILDGGNVSSTNDGGAVYVSGGTFTMNDGVTITNCNAKDGGAVYITDIGTFNMNGGTIDWCSATNSGGGVWMDSGSSFTMSGDSNIKYCNSSEGGGGGVYVTDSSNPCTFKMLGNATITECIARNGGGGVSYGCGPDGIFEILENAEISNNEDYGNGGGGIYLYGKLTMDGGTISGNEALSGAGVYLSDSTSSFTMNGGEIKNNKATQSSYSGIYVLGNINIEGGSICDNYVGETNYGASIYNPKSDEITVLDQTIPANSHFTKNIIDGEVKEVSSSGGGNATQSITTFSDLRSAIDEANTNSSFYTLENPCVIYIGDSFSTDGDTVSTLTISTHVKLVANNTDGCTITKTSGYAGTNIFIVSSGASLTLGDETATGILTIDGAGDDVQSTKSLINVSGTLVLNEKSVLQNSYIKNSTHGGAVYSSGGTIKVHGGVVQNNTIIVNSKYGGGIYLENGTFEMTSGTFQGNSGSVTSGYMYGGALYFDSCTVNITGGTFINNSVLGSSDCYGGAIYISNSGNTSTPAKISNCTFNSNSAYQRGGAIYIGGSTTCIYINNCTFSGNSVTNSGADGGAIYVGNTGGDSVTISECNFASNTASSSENTIYNGSSSVSVIVDETTVASSSVWNPSTSGGE